MKFNLRPFGHVIYDTTLVFIVSSTICSIMLYGGEIDRSEANITIGVASISSALYYFLVYKSKK